METNKTIDNLAKNFIKSIENTSDKRIELELQNRGLTNFEEIVSKTVKKAKEESKKVIKEEIDSLKKDMFVTFGIFTSFIAFIVGEINILKTIDSIYDKVGFSFLFVSFILGFLFGVMFLFSDEAYEKKAKQMIYVFSFFFVVGIGFIILPHLLKEPVYYMIIK